MTDYEDTIQNFQDVNAERRAVEDEADRLHDTATERAKLLDEELGQRILSQPTDDTWRDDLHTLHMLWNMEANTETGGDPQSWSVNYYYQLLQNVKSDLAYQKA